jgi:CPA2 family monovalent cation:H+ antiporter-2
MLGLEYTGDELKKSLRLGIAAGVIDFVLNFTPGVAAGLVFRWQPLAAVLLGGITYISSSGVIAKVLTELQRMDKPETPLVLSVLVQEDLAMAVYLPLVAVLLSGGGTARIALSVCIAIAVVSVALLAALRWGPQISRLFAHESDEIILLTTIGAVLLVAGVAQRFQVSAAIGAFLVGIALSGSVAEKSQRLVSPLRDLFAALFFFFFGLEIDPAALLPSLPFALGLGVVTTFTKVLTGDLAGRSLGIDPRGRIRAGAALVARGEFSIVIAGLGVAIEPRLGPLSAAYVLLMAIAGPVLARAAK